MNTNFLDSAGLPKSIQDQVTVTTPWSYFSMEFGLENLSFAGGLGILAGDMLLEASKLEIPFVGITLYYPKGIRQHITPALQVGEETLHFPPATEVGFKKISTVTVAANSGSDHVPIEVFQKEFGSAEILTLFEPGLGTLYQWETESEHRLFQETVLGFGGIQALKMLGKTPKVFHLNESATVFGAVAALDDLISTQKISLEEALHQISQQVIFTNHTLVPAAVAGFRIQHFEKYIFPNIKNEQVKIWLRELIAAQHDRKLNLSKLAMALSYKLNGVSKIHARIASDGRFHKPDGTTGHFTPVTNGICLDRWIHPSILSYYNETGLLTNDQWFDDKKPLEKDQMKQRKNIARTDLRNFLQHHKNQYGNPVDIPYDAPIACWARRFAEYKRPSMLFHNHHRLKELINQYGLHIILSGKVYLSDNTLIHKLFHLVDTDPILKGHIHFIQGYGIELGQKLTQGVDIWLNTPVVGEEACGTSWMKAVGNLAVLISTPDGGVADVDTAPLPYLVVTGKNYEAECEALYKNLEEAAKIVKDDERWYKFISYELEKFLPVISPARMWSQYLKLVFS